MTTIEIVTKYIAAMLPMVPHANEFELILEEWQDLRIEELKELNSRGYLFTGELMEVEQEDDDGNIIGHCNIYYFKL